MLFPAPQYKYAHCQRGLLVRLEYDAEFMAKVQDTLTLKERALVKEPPQPPKFCRWKGTCLTCQSVLTLEVNNK